MDLAVKEHLTEHNPCRDVEVSRPRSAERTPLTLEEAISLEREIVRDGRAARVEEWRITASSAADLLEIQRGAGAPITIDGSRITVMAKEAWGRRRHDEAHSLPNVRGHRRWTGRRQSPG